MDSTTNSNLNKCQLVGDEAGDSVNVIHYKWSEWFEDVGFSNLPGIRKLHYLRFESKTPNFVQDEENLTDSYVSVK